MKRLLNYYSTYKELFAVFPILFVVILIIWSVFFPRNASAGDFNWHKKDFALILSEDGELHCVGKENNKRVNLKNCPEIF